MKRAIDLASDRLRGYVLASSDQAFTSHAHLLSSLEVAPGQGWRTRRRRESGHEWVIVRLGVPGVIEALELDTRYQEGHLPTHVSLEGCTAAHVAPVDSLKSWETLLPKTALEEGALHRFLVSSEKRYSHVRLNIFPDGGVARLRVLGRPVPSWMAPGTAAPAALDLAAVSNGGEVATWSSALSEPEASSLLYPGSSCQQHPGWLTPRRRQAGHEWLTVRLCGPGRLASVTLDTERLESDCPAKASLEGASSQQEPDESEWFELLPQEPLLPNTEHTYSLEASGRPEVRWVRLNLHPDGGMARLRLWGALSEQGIVECRLRYLNSASSGELREIFRAVCHSDRWASQMALAGPFDSVSDLQKKGASAWSHCREADWREALLGHPRIGEKAKGGDLASRWSRGEQSKASTPDEELKAELREKQLQYEERFGFLFLICATGRTTEQILSVLKSRLEQSPELELQTVAEELAKIIHLRLEKLLVS